jgi:hypothetical protein
MKKLLILSTLLIATACTTNPTSREQEAAFWQRSNSTSALYLRGPKAQHTLHKDIASCVSEVKELSRLGTIRNANPPGGIEMNVGLANNWQSPRGDGPLNTEFRDFHDFESCMAFKGWERTRYVKPEQIQQAKHNYNTVILGKTLDSQDNTPSYKHNNESSASTGFNN